KYTTGTICRVHESLATPAEHIFSQSEGIKENPVLRQPFLDQLENIYSPGEPGKRRMGKERPCIVMENISAKASQQPGPHMRTEGPLICVMGTFGGTMPHGQWIIAFIYRCPNPILGVWSFVRRGGGRERGSTTSVAHPDEENGEAPEVAPEWWLDRETIGWLRAECRQRLKEWGDKCRANGNFARECALEYRVKRLQARRSSWGSMGSTRTPQRSRPGTPLSTVPEGGWVSAPGSPRHRGAHSRCNSPSPSVR
ncbi:hypothetical protein C8Q77DRAFT_1038785, partial [Trametes polyzona]